MSVPHPLALRLHTRARDAARARVPLGLNAWTDGAEDVAVLLEAVADDGGSLAQIVEQLPDVSSLPQSATVVVLGEAVRHPSSWRRWLGSRTVAIPRSIRCAGLLVRGYVDIGAAICDGKEDLVWGRTSSGLS